MYFRLGTRKSCNNCDDAEELPILTMSIIIGNKSYRLTRYDSDDPSVAREVIYCVTDEGEEKLIRSLEPVGKIEILTDEQVDKAKDLNNDFVFMTLEEKTVPWDEIKAQLQVFGINGKED